MTIDIVAITSGRARPVADAYVAHRRNYAGACPFCSAPHAVGGDVVAVEGTMVVLRNLFPYALWDSAPVEEHLMVVPARHLLVFDEFTDQEASDYFAVLRRYEAAGYSVYTRAQSNLGRSVGHLHTHLLRTRHG
jgi:diadenosine tetraphosphate (Ap4A) HIT family hydrolase